MISRKCHSKPSSCLLFLSLLVYFLFITYSIFNSNLSAKSSPCQWQKKACLRFTHKHNSYLYNFSVLYAIFRRKTVHKTSSVAWKCDLVWSNCDTNHYRSRFLDILHVMIHLTWAFKQRTFQVVLKGNLSWSRGCFDVQHWMPIHGFPYCLGPNKMAVIKKLATP